MDRSELERFNIYELRAKGRSVGVKAVTTKKQSVIIDEIIKIENGELAPVKNKMGRPPKNAVILDEADEILEKRTLMPEEYAIEGNINFEFKLEATPIYADDALFSYTGVVRGLNNKYFVKNYGIGAQFILLPSKLSDVVGLGDIVRGKAYPIGNGYGLAVNCDTVKLTSEETVEGSRATVLVCKDIESMYSYTIMDKSAGKIVSEVESRGTMLNRVKDSGIIPLFTRECSDIVTSYNMLLDLKSVAQNLSQQGRQFTLYLVDVEYIYSILSMYYEAKDYNADLNAGQYFKELLSIVLDSKFGRVIFFEKENNKRNSYLDIILSRYCNY